MQNLWKRPRRQDQPQTMAPAALSPATGLTLSDMLGQVISGIGCLTANVAQAAQEIQRKLVAGEIDEETAADMTMRLRNAHQDIESACRLVSRVRAEASPAEQHEAAHHA